MNGTAADREGYQGDWTEAISNQQVFKGMSATDVFLSWGRPQHRFRTLNEEKWIYYFPGENPEQFGRIVRLFFVDGSLRQWSVDRGFTEFTGQDQAGEISDFMPPPPEPESGK